MSYSARELSDNNGKPRELYWFMRNTESWTYTSAADSIEFESQVFTPVNGLSRSNVKTSGERSKAQLTVEMPRDTLIAKEFIGIPNVNPVWLYVYRIHEGETEFRITWQGRVRFADFAGIKSTLTLDSILASSKKQALRHLFQNQCNHFTFDANCTLSESDYEVDVTVDSLDGNKLTADATQNADYFTAGQVRRANGDRRFIVSDTKVSATHTLELLTPFEDMEVGEAVTIIGGACRHTFSTCAITVKANGTGVDNTENYGGYPKVPRKNPFKSFH